MATKVVMAQLSPTMEEGKLLEWKVSEGDDVEQGDIVAEIETDKANMDVEAMGSGVLRKIVVQAGETVPVGQLIGVIAAADEDIEPLLAEAGAAGSAASDGAGPEAAAAPEAGAATEEATAEATDRATGEATEEATTAEATDKADGGEPEADAAVESEPTEAESPEAAKGASAAPTVETSGRVTEPAADGAPVGDVPTPQGEGVAGPASAGDGRIKASPVARKMAEAAGLELSGIAGSGPAGRIVKADVEAAVSGAATARVAPTQAATPDGPPGTPAAVSPAAPPRLSDERIEASQMRKAIARRLTQSLGPIPHFFLTTEIDMERVLDLRSELNAGLDGFKIGVTDVLLKTAAEALARHPEVNASWDEDAIQRHGTVDLGLAVAVEDGLITPVLRDADRKGLRQIAEESAALIERARARRLTPEEYQGATFTISNLGMFEIEEFTAVINPPEAAILAVAKTQQKPVVVDGEVQVRRRMRVTMSCDHRVVDGATGARFLATFKQMLENPLTLVL